MGRLAAVLMLLAACGPKAGARDPEPVDPAPRPFAEPSPSEPTPQLDLQACYRDQCGPRRMGMPNWTCPDGTTGGPVCVRQGGGRCGWRVLECPGIRALAARRAPPPVTPPPPPRPARHACDSLPDHPAMRSWPVTGVYRSPCTPFPTSRKRGPCPRCCEMKSDPVLAQPTGPSAARPCRAVGPTGVANPRATSTYQPPREVIDLGDGTFIAEKDGRCFRARWKRCTKKCLPPETPIATPAGDVAVSELRAGAPVWILDARGRRVAATVLEVSSVAVDPGHRVVELGLADGRSVTASAGHPALGGQAIDRLSASSPYAGSEIVAITARRYRGLRTHDLRVSGPTGIYFASGVPLESTLTPARPRRR